VSGPPPKPTVLKALAGNPGKRPLNDREASFPVPGRMLNAPDHLTAEAIEAWRTYGPMLLRVGLFTRADAAALEMLCQAYGRWKHAEREVEATGGEILLSEKGGMYYNPWRAVANRAWDQLYKMLAQFGMTPAERSRVAAMLQDGESEQSLAEMLFSEVAERAR